MNTRKIGTIVLAATAALVALGCGAGPGKEVSSKDPVVSNGSSTAPKNGTSSPPKLAYPPLTPKDITLKVKILEKKCFGSAGCNVEFRISSFEVTPGKLDPEATYEVTYTYKGLSDPVENRFTLSGDGTGSVDESEYGQTKSKTSKVTAVVTSVEKM